ncbi:hypothetical protein K443DRAFT_413667 [Laccaria amethystina LaAM-08-1]|jgi:hypothetical protein|uniref:Uncharacterized protein n=1 Tax=Laccaria amethystina LaAM-08-1 TaxID=1095629 RepID=A0A0C9WPW8_9AGAR|nr:hypothetical protein K443DRAFT_413667 [Laccaria amethystina LaAM-08-1]
MFFSEGSLNTSSLTFLVIAQDICLALIVGSLPLAHPMDLPWILQNLMTSPEKKDVIKVSRLVVRQPPRDHYHS